MSDDEGSGGPVPSGRLDVPTLRVLARRATTHPLVLDWAFDSSSVSPRLLRLSLNAHSYPNTVRTVRIDIRWFNTDDYSFHYVEERDGETAPHQCRWDRHPKTTVPQTHFHPPPNTGDAESVSLDSHHLAVLFSVLDWVSERIERLHAE